MFEGAPLYRFAFNANIIRVISACCKQMLTFSAQKITLKLFVYNGTADSVVTSHLGKVPPRRCQ